MAPSLRCLRVPRPKTFLCLMSLRTGVEMISLSMLFNKIAGLFGLLAVFTGFRLDVTQLSMYLYSVAALVLTAYLTPHIRKQHPLECLTLAWFYTFDTIINTAYIAAFSVTWFITMSTVSSETQGHVPFGAPGSATINDAAGFISPKYNVSEVNVVASPATDLTGGQDAVAIGATTVASATLEGTGFKHGVGLAGSIPSMVIIVMLTIVRIYFILVMMAYARQVIQQYMVTASGPRQHLHMDEGRDAGTDSPFAHDMPEGQGWRGKMGRAMVWSEMGYFLRRAVDDDWEIGLSNRFKQAVPLLPSDPRGTFERERRARSGTGPPIPPPEITKLDV